MTPNPGKMRKPSKLVVEGSNTIDCKNAWLTIGPDDVAPLLAELALAVCNNTERDVVQVQFTGLVQAEKARRERRRR